MIGMYENIIANTIIICEAPKCFCLTLGTMKDGNSPFLFRIVLVSAVKQEKEIEGIWIKKRQIKFRILIAKDLRNVVFSFLASVIQRKG